MNTELPTVDALAATYNTPGYADPMDAVADFNEYQRQWASTQLGSSAISTRMELPRGRLRSWEDGAKPDVVRGIETARGHEWLEQPVDGEQFAALNRLVAGVYSGDSISTDTYEPSFSAPDQIVEEQLRVDLETLGAGCRRVLSNSGNVEELRAESDTTVLGRVLVALGAPQGPKAQTATELPSYLYGSEVPEGLRREFVRVYVSNRATVVRDRDFLQIHEERPKRYLDAVAKLVEDVTGVEVWRGKKTIRFRESALDVLGLD